MSHNLNSLGILQGTTMAVINGDTRSLDDGPHASEKTLTAKADEPPIIVALKRVKGLANGSFHVLFHFVHIPMYISIFLNRMIVIIWETSRQFLGLSKKVTSITLFFVRPSATSYTVDLRHSFKASLRKLLIQQFLKFICAFTSFSWIPGLYCLGVSW